MDVLVVGAGPVGLAMAAELARHEVPCRIIDANEGRTDRSRALVLWPRSLEILEQMGCVGDAHQVGESAYGASIYIQGRRAVHLTLDDLPSRFPYALMIPQAETERVLEEHLGRLGVQVERRTELMAIEQDDDGVTAELRKPDGSTERARCRWLVGCDGAHSTVRHQLQVPFDGETLESGFALADVHIDGSLARDEWEVWWSQDGFLACFPIPPDRFRLVVDVPPDSADAGDPTVAEIQEWLDRRAGKGFKARDPVWTTRFRVNERKVVDYRRGRCFLAGDAAHVHSPAGGQGMNTGIQDAHNLAWKLALVAAGQADTEPLLASYSAERGKVARHVLEGSGRLTQMAMLRHPLAEKLRDGVVELVGKLGLMQRAVKKDLSELGIRYADSPITAEHRDLSATSWMLGHGVKAGARLPDVHLLLDAESRTVDVYSLMSDRRWHLFLLGGVHHSRAGLDRIANLGRWATERYDQVMCCHLVLHETSHEDAPHWRGQVLEDREKLMHEACGAAHDTVVLVRPDGYVGFRSQPSDFDALSAYVDRIGLKRASVRR